MASPTGDGVEVDMRPTRAQWGTMARNDDEEWKRACSQHHLAPGACNLQKSTIMRYRVLVPTICRMVTGALAGGGRPSIHQRHRNAWVAQPDLHDNNADGHHAEPMSPTREVEHEAAMCRLRITTINLNSLMAHLEEIEYQTADVLVVTESRVTKEDLPLVQAAAGKVGFQVSQRAVARRRQQGPEHSGVMIMVREPYRLSSPPLDGILNEWAHMGRFDAVQVRGPGQMQVMILGHYAHAQWRADLQLMQQEQEFFEALFEWQHAEGITGAVLCGDFNAQPDEHLYQCVVNSQIWYDALKEDETPRRPTYLGAGGSTCIDHVFLDGLLQPTMTASGTSDDTPGQHRAVWVECCIPLQAEVVQPYLPKTEQSMLKPMPEERVAGWSWRHLEDEFYEAVTTAQVELSWALWCRRWEELLLTRAQYWGQPTTAVHRGRGTLPKPRKGVFNVARRSPVGHETLRIRQLRRLKGQAQEIAMATGSTGGARPYAVEKLYLQGATASCGC